MQLKVLVLGGTGFIGSHLVDKLVNDYDVLVYAKSKGNYENAKATYVYGDFTELDKLKNALTGVNVLYHLLSTTVPVTANQNPVFDVETNLVSTLRFLPLLENSTVKKVIYVSSGGTVYGNPEHLPIKENHPLKPLGSYGIVKEAIENYIKMYAHEIGFDYTIIRPSNPYGPRQSYRNQQGVIPTFMHKMLNDELIEIWGDGNEVRDYIFVNDLVDGLAVICNIRSESEVYNIGSGQGNSVLDIIGIIENITHKQPKINWKPKKAYAVEQVVLDVSRIKADFYWQPKTRLDKGIEMFYNWIRSNYHI